jgi:hypothetical protein
MRQVGRRERAGRRGTAVRSKGTDPAIGDTKSQSRRSSQPRQCPDGGAAARGGVPRRGGVWTKVLAARGPTVTALDTSPEMLERNRAGRTLGLVSPWCRGGTPTCRLGVLR